MLDLDCSFTQKEVKRTIPKEFQDYYVSIVSGISQVKALSWLKLQSRKKEG